MLTHNKQMQDFLKLNGIKAIPKRIDKGSLKGTWRLLGSPHYHLCPAWTNELSTKLNNLGFVGFDGKPLGQFSGNGGKFCVFVRRRLN